MLVFEFRELPRPKGWGEFYFRLPSAKRGVFVGDLDLYKASGDDLRELFEKGINKAVSDSEKARELLTKKEYQTENIADWAAEILKGAVDQHMQKEAG